MRTGVIARDVATTQSPSEGTVRSHAGDCFVPLRFARRPRNDRCCLRYVVLAVAAVMAGCAAPGSAPSGSAEMSAAGGYEPDLGMALGRRLLHSDPAQAERIFLKVVARSPRNAAALNDLGIARDVLGRHREAQAAYRAALAVSPELRAASINLALSLALDGDGAGAARVVGRLRGSSDASAAEQADLAAVAALADRAPTGNVLAGN